MQRWIKFVKYLRHFGIEPIVYIPTNPNYPITDPTIGNDLPENIKIISHPIWEPYFWASFLSKKKTKNISSGIIPSKKKKLTEKILLWIRGNIFIPDARIFWVKPSVAYLKKYIKNNNIQTIITTSPPHSIHLIGEKLKKQMPHLKWIADFRDPWTSISYHKHLLLTKYSQKQHKILEKRVLNTADQLITTSQTTRNEFAQITPKPIEVITNGYDNITYPSTPLSNKFMISHIGSLLSERNPRVLWKVFAEMLQTVDDFKDDFQLVFAGKVSPEILDELNKLGLNNYIINKGYLSHNEAIAIQQQSQILLLIEINSEDTKGIIPGKIFEYMVSGRPILAIGPKEWEAAQIIMKTNTGKSVLYNDKEKLKNIIKKWYDEYKKGKIVTHPIGLAPYSRKNLTKRLADLCLK